MVLVPVLRRPHRVVPLLESLGDSACALFIASPDDHEEQAAIRRAGADMIVLEQPPRHGDYARKINAGYRQSTEEWLFLGADDLSFHDGWLGAAMAEQTRVVGTNDLGNPRVIAGGHATHSLVHRSYVDQFGTIDEPGKLLHEGYPHEFVDDEFVATAKLRGEWSFAAESVVEHLHPSWGKAPMDSLYARQRQRMRAGRKVFERRSHLWT